VNARPRPVWMLSEEARAIFGRISSSRTVDGQVVQLGAALAVSRHLLGAVFAPGSVGEEKIALVFDGLQEGLDHLEERILEERREWSARQ
jgi:hypothetical protein